MPLIRAVPTLEDVGAAYHMIERHVLDRKWLRPQNHRLSDRLNHLREATRCWFAKIAACALSTSVSSRQIESR